MFAALVVLLAVIATVSAKLFTENLTHQKYMWESFKAEHHRNYDTFEEEVKRFGFFLENLKMVDLRNEAELRNGGSAVHGITQFSDMSQAEFEGRYLKADVTQRQSTAEVAKIEVDVTDTTAVDWTGKYTTPVKNQGYCGSCWAFSAVSQIESDSMRTLGYSTLLSPEQVTQCDTKSKGCNGGWTENAYKYVQGNGGIETDSAYPYTSGTNGVTGTCHADKTKNVIKVNGYYTVSGESAMTTYLQKTGPLSVCLDASSWNSYTGGIMSVCGKSVDHCVQAVGVNPASTGGYWKVRNQWGTSWGESGFIRLAYGKDTCHITNDPTYVSVSKI